MSKKKKHAHPEIYRIKYKAGISVMKSTQYYTVFHSSEALEDICHTFHTGKIHAKRITIYKIEEYNKFTDKWEDRSDTALAYSEGLGTIIIKNNKIILER